MAFRLKCVSELISNLGKYDAIVEFTEIAIRDFIDYAYKSDDFDSYLKSKSEAHKIKVDTVDRLIYRSRISQSYILSVYQTFELFLRQFKDEHNDLFNGDWKFDDSTDSLLIKLIRKITTINNAKIVIGDFRLELFDYYRKVRNKYSHDYIDDSKMDKAFAQVIKFKTDISNGYPKLSAPNEFEKINFDDFVLFTRLVKDIAYELNNIIQPISDNLLVDYYRRKDMFKSLGQNIPRKINAIKGHLRENFGIVDDSEKIINLYLSHSPNG